MTIFLFEYKKNMAIIIFWIVMMNTSIIDMATIPVVSISGPEIKCNKLWTKLYLGIFYHY